MQITDHSNNSVHRHLYKIVNNLCDKAGLTTPVIYLQYGDPNASTSVWTHKMIVNNLLLTHNNEPILIPTMAHEVGHMMDHHGDYDDKLLRHWIEIAVFFILSLFLTLIYHVLTRNTVVITTIIVLSIIVYIATCIFLMFRERLHEYQADVNGAKLITPQRMINTLRLYAKNYPDTNRDSISYPSMDERITNVEKAFNMIHK